MKVGQMENLDPFPRSLRRSRMLWLRLGKQARQVEGCKSWRRAELAIKVVANVLSVQTSHVCQCQHLGPDSSETPCLIVVNASCVGGKLESLAEPDQKTWHALRRILSDGFSNTQCSFTPCTIASRGITLDYAGDIDEGSLQ